MGSGTASFASVVSNTKALYIELDVTTAGTIEAGIDNVHTTIPEPGTLCLLTLGGITLFRRRKR